MMDPTSLEPTRRRTIFRHVAGRPADAPYSASACPSLPSWPATRPVDGRRWASLTAPSRGSCRRLRFDCVSAGPSLPSCPARRPWTVGAGPFTAPSRGRCRWLHFDCGVVDWRRPTPPLSFAFTGDRRRTYTVVCRRSARFVGASAQRGKRWTRRLSSPPSHPRYPPRWRQPRRRKCCRPSRSNCWETDPVTAQYTHLDANSFPLQSRSCPPLVGGGWDFRCCFDGGSLLSYVAQLCKSLEP